MRNPYSLNRSIRGWILFFIIALLLSGITAFAIESELAWVCSWWPERDSRFYHWLASNYSALKTTNEKFPSLAYGYDWLAFAHIIIAISFIGPYKDPIKNSWIIQTGMIACVLIIPLALIAGAIRKIPWFWQLIDMSFGFLGLIPLAICYHKIRLLEKIKSFT
jgi:hypothetical protein